MLEKVKTPKALTIAGSDSGGGAGIQADLKTFAALGVHGMSAITAITAQNTLDVIAVHDVPPEIIKAQIEAVVEDIGVDVAKTGMLHSVESIDVVADEMKESKFPIVVDPVMIAKGGARLIKAEAKHALVDKILPIATVVTPNAHEAGVLAGMEVRGIEEAKKAAVKIAELGPNAVVIKGGHIPGERIIDVLYLNGNFELFSSEVIKTKTMHGTGCSFASAVAAGLAREKSIRDSVKFAKEFITKAIRFGLKIGKGYGPVNPTAWLYNRAEKYETLKNVMDAVRLLESELRIIHLVPEVHMNLVMATPHATTINDVVGIPGRIVRVKDRVKASSCPEFGASRHVASMVLTAMQRDPSFRAGINIRYSPKIISICDKLGFSTASYDRRKEPEELKDVEGATVPWGTMSAIESVGCVPDIIYHLGDFGKEAIATILASSATEAVEKAQKIVINLMKTDSIAI